MANTHSFHIPVMGIAYTIDTPLKVSQYGINSVISLVDDMLLEKLRKMYCEKFQIPYKEISDKINHKPVELFLKANNLSLFQKEFTAFLEKGNLTEFRNQVFNKTGKTLIVLSFLPGYIQQTYNVLSITHQGNTGPTYYLFWKPTMEIENFYYGYKHKQIMPLQKLLKNIGLYDFQIDGIAGSILIKGLTQFQRQNKLVVTGFPDPETLFLLNNIQK